MSAIEFQNADSAEGLQPNGAGAVVVGTVQPDGSIVFSSPNGALSLVPGQTVSGLLFSDSAVAGRAKIALDQITANGDHWYMDELTDDDDDFEPITLPPGSPSIQDMIRDQRGD